MKQYTAQFAVLLVVCGITVCLAGEEKKCPSEVAKLQPIKCDKENCKFMDGNFKVVKCSYSVFCDTLSCIDITFVHAEKVYFHASGYNDRSSNVYATVGYFSPEKPGVYLGTFQDYRLDGNFYVLLVTEKLNIVVACLKYNQQLVIFVNSRDEKLDASEEELVKKTLEKNGLKTDVLKSPAYKDCGKLKSNYKEQGPEDKKTDEAGKAAEGSKPDEGSKAAEADIPTAEEQPNLLQKISEIAGKLPLPGKH